MAGANVDQRLLANHAGAAHFLDLAVTVGDHPMARRVLPVSTTSMILSARPISGASYIEP